MRQRIGREKLISEQLIDLLSSALPISWQAASEA
jgi:hypothetical protein